MFAPTERRSSPVYTQRGGWNRARLRAVRLENFAGGYPAGCGGRNRGKAAALPACERSRTKHNSNPDSHRKLHEDISWPAAHLDADRALWGYERSSGGRQRRTCPFRGPGPGTAQSSPTVTPWPASLARRSHPHNFGAAALSRISRPCPPSLRGEVQESVSPAPGCSPLWQLRLAGYTLTLDDYAAMSTWPPSSPLCRWSKWTSPAGLHRRRSCASSGTCASRTGSWPRRWSLPRLRSARMLGFSLFQGFFSRARDHPPAARSRGRPARFSPPARTGPGGLRGQTAHRQHRT
jgi:hypothetical protein